MLMVVFSPLQAQVVVFVTQNFFNVPRSCTGRECIKGDYYTVLFIPNLLYLGLRNHDIIDDVYSSKEVLKTLASAVNRSLDDATAVLNRMGSW